MADKINSANDIHVHIEKDNGEILIDNSFCTTINISLNQDGEIATSFFGAYNPTIVKGLEKTTKEYFKALKKQLKTYIPPEDIKVSDEDLPEDKKWKEEPIKTTKKRKAVIKPKDLEENKK